MILANLVKAVREQNYYAVFLEFVIVIAGVVVGFQVTAWNADRAEREIITQQLAEVREDIQADISVLETTLNASLWRFAAAEYLLTRIESDTPLPRLMLVFEFPIDRDMLPEITQDDHPTLLARVNLIRGRTGQRTGYESLVNGGSLRLIEDQELRAAIQRYYTGYEDLQNNLAIFRDIRAPAMTILYRHGFSLFSEQDLDTVLEAARSDLELTAYIRTGLELAMAQISITLEREEQAQELLALINAALEDEE
ncbi:hypothetical protein V0U79_06080 [Hyphobacterium sp. HN65]|uniref:Uncharacterized protein n=1 Tax=Hyphobacterium lacteum TaxID=3116575 RepID=A0ABU7LPU8_9PROT|nr:hypothetical protein [Hyphobacterium sp. HN65]MEE2525927.1 hypothetical protein [Hyphobacterium sp. HN65]